MDLDRERLLAERARRGDSEARADLIIAGLRAVVLRARMLGLSGEELRDAVQAGSIGLIRAVDRFDPDRGARLATYAWRWIGAEMVVARRPEVPLEEADGACHPHADVEDGLLDGLSDEGAQVLRLRFGLGDGDRSPMSRAAVAQQLGTSVARVRTIEGKAMRQLRERLAKVVDRAPLQ